jgi:hypothetical protein
MTALVVLAAGAVPAWGFTPKWHAHYATLAHEMMSSCHPAGPLHVDAFVRGAKAEDDPSFERSANWHYARNEKMPRYFVLPPAPVGFRTDMDAIFARRLAGLHDPAIGKSGKCSTEAVFEMAGRVSHYLQDVRVPAHVIPIDHGFLFPKEPFDSYDFDLNPPDMLVTECKELSAAANVSSRHAITRRLAAARDDTLARIHTRVFTDGPNCTWSDVFWCDHRYEQCEGPQLNGFGLHRAGTKFGQPAIQCDGAERSIGKADYRRFFRQAHAEMLRDTAFMLLYAKALAVRLSCD